MSSVVNKSSAVMVRPSEEPGQAAADVQLSSLDKGFPPIPIASFLMFDQPIDKPTESIKQALSQALVHYRPVSGRLAGDRIACNELGVPFVGASATCALDELTPALLPDLAVGYVGPLCREEDPLLQMQVTEFSCGGFVVGVTWNHTLADGVGMGQFLQAVGELARVLPRPSVVPVRSATALGARGVLPPSTVGTEKSAMSFHPKKGEGAFLDTTVPWSLIDRVRAQCAGCTVFDAVAAVLWRCRTRAAIPDTDKEAPAPLAFPCNVRKLFGLGPDDGYYGNCLIMQWVPATRAQVADGDIGDVVRLIRRAKEKIPETLEGGAAERQQSPLYNMLGLSSWVGLGLDEVDFGGGRPARVMWHDELMVVPTATLCPPCKGKNDDGVNVLSVCVKPEHVDAFLAELAAM